MDFFKNVMTVVLLGGAMIGALGVGMSGIAFVLAEILLRAFPGLGPSVMKLFGWKACVTPPVIRESATVIGKREVIGQREVGKHEIDLSEVWNGKTASAEERDPDNVGFPVPVMNAEVAKSYVAGIMRDRKQARTARQARITERRLDVRRQSAPSTRYTALRLPQNCFSCKKPRRIFTKERPHLCLSCDKTKLALTQNVSAIPVNSNQKGVALAARGNA